MQPALGKPPDRPLQEGRCGPAALIGQHFNVGDAAMVIDGHMHVFPAGAFDDGAPVAMNAMAHAQNAGERFHIEVHERARRRVFVPLDPAAGPSAAPGD
jgi:hypothetical protein